jgi:cytochrome c peroxidase
MKHGRVLLGAVILTIAVTSLASAQLTPMEELGKAIYFDKISAPDNMACATCHDPMVGFTGPVPGINDPGAVYPGAVKQRFGNRKPPSAAYATTAPLFHWDATEELFIGGNFWDGRATGDHLGNPAADQALGPFLNPVEQNNPSKLAVLEQIASSKYAGMWEVVWGNPLSLDPADTDMEYDRIGLAIAEFEDSDEVNQFSSKFDYYQMGEAELTAKEAWGEELFNGKAMCVLCHMPPFFTDYSFDNLGVPRNPDNPFYDMDEVYLDDGSPINPLGADWIDPGLGGFLATLPESYFTNLGLDKETAVMENWGKHKVPTLRNVDKRPSENFAKTYMHNGAFNDLKVVVDFYNSRDVADWPAPEVAANVNTDELGNLGLTKKEVNAIVAFMATLSDGWVPKMKKSQVVTTVTAPSARLLVGPNPFNPMTRLSYTLPEAGNVRINVYDMAGRHVTTLVKEWKPGGQHELVWAPSGLSSGQYVVLFEAPSVKMSRKVTILK